MLSFSLFAQQSTINITTSGGFYTTEKWVSITTEVNGGGTQVWGQGDGTYGNGQGLINENISLDPGTYYVNCYDRYSDGWDGTLISVTAYGSILGDNGGVSPSDSSTNDSTSSWEDPADELEASFEIIVPNPPDCTGPTITAATLVDNCSEDGTFSVELVVSDAGDAGTQITADVVDFTPVNVTVGTLMVGPFDSGDSVTLNIVALDEACNVTLGEFTFTCPPNNDLFVDAIPVSCGDSVLGTTIGATLDESDASSTATVEQDTSADVDSPWVWYSYAGAVAGERVTLSTCGTDNTDFDTELFIYTGTSGNLTLIDDGYDECGGSSENYAAETSFDSDGSSTYYIAVGGYNSGNVGNFQLTVSCEAPPECTGPIVDSVTVVETCSEDGTGTFNVEVVVSDAGDAGTVISDGTNTYPVVAGTVVAGPYNSGDNVSLSIDATDDACDADLGDYTFTCPPPAPDNETCATATAIACGETINATSVGSTGTQEGSGCSIADNGIWFTFTGTGGEMTVIVDASFDHEVALSTGTCGDLTNVNCDDQSVGTETHVFDSVLDATYYVYVAYYSSFGTAQTGTVDITLECEITQDPCANTVAYTWTGASDSNWENASNWSNSMAPSLMVMNGEVTIPNGMSNYPMLTMGQDLYIDACSSVTVASMASLSVGPNVEVVNDGMVDNSGAVTFESDATGTGYVGAGTGMFMGDYTVERYIPAKRAYRQLSPAVTTNTPIADNWQQDTHITGPAGNTDGFDVTVTGNPSMYIFDNVGYEYVEVANTNATNLYPGTMYHILVRGDRNTDLMDNNAAPSETTLRATGELTSENVGSHMISVNVPEQRFVAVGNPFQAQVDMNNLLNNNSMNINPNFYWVWDPTLGYRGAYTTIMTSSGVATAGSDADQYLQSGQAGWVYTSGAGQASVMFDQSSKDNSGMETSTFSDNSTNNQGLLTLSLFENTTLANGGSPVDGILIMSSSNGNNAIDGNDAMDITNLDENFAVNNNGSLLSIESRAIPVDAEVIQLEINTYRSTNYTIVAEGGSLLGATPFLYDSYTGTYTEIPMNGSVNYTFSVDSNSLSSISGDRFTIVYEQETLSVGGFDLTEVMLYPNPTNIGKFHLNVPLGMDDLEITIYDVLGTKLYQESGFAAGNRITVETGDGFSMGTYFVELTSKGKTTTKKLIIN
ncbi:MAG: hypothetical protein Wins2KO_20290 [Winogradskyella sp.]